MPASNGSSSQDHPAGEGNGISLLRKIWNIPGRRAPVEPPADPVSTNIYDVPPTTQRIPPRRRGRSR